MKFRNLKTKYLGRNNFYFEIIDSTQDEIHRRIENNIENGTMIVAEKQTMGRGTHGRKWYTEKNDSIAFSFYVKTDCKIDDLDGITVEIAEILIDIFKEVYNIKLDIKFPNDIMINNKKIAGILVESKILNEKVKYLVVGIGINTNKKIFNEEIKNIATSIFNEYSIKIDNELVITLFCNEFEKRLDRRLEK